MRVSRKWNEIAAVLLYRDLGVRFTRLPDFPSSSLTDKYKPLVRTLSISMTAEVSDVPNELLIPNYRREKCSHKLLSSTDR